MRRFYSNDVYEDDNNCDHAKNSTNDIYNQ